MIRKLPYMEPLEKYEYRITENPIEEIWHLIDLATSEEIFLEKSSTSLSKNALPFITESIVQAEEFKSSAASCTEHTKPLQLYYCFNNLTKAVLAWENNSIPPGHHGLKKVEIPSSGELSLEALFKNSQRELPEGLLLIAKKIYPSETVNTFYVTAYSRI